MNLRSAIRNIPMTTRFYGGIILVLLAILLFQNVGGDAPNTVSAPAVPGEVQRIVITDRDSAITLENRDGRWFVGPGGMDAATSTRMYPGDTEQIERLLEQLRTLSRLQVVSFRGNYGEYGLEESVQRIVRVEGRQGDALSLALGFSAVAGDTVYGRVSGERPVVRLPRSLHNAVSANPDDYRDMVVARIAEDTIGRIEIRSDREGRVTIRPSDATQARDDQGESNGLQWALSGSLLDQISPVRPERIRDLFHELSRLEAIGFPAKEPREATGDSSPFVVLVIQTVIDGEHRLEIYPPDDDRRFYAESTTVDYPFLLPEWRVRRLLLGIEAYLLPYMDDPPPIAPGPSAVP